MDKRVGGLYLPSQLNKTVQYQCTALPRLGFFIEPPPDTQQRIRRRGERGTGVTKGSYLLLNNLPLPLPPPPTRTARLLDCLGLRYQNTSPPP
jgi:hypothetical protein